MIPFCPADVLHHDNSFSIHNEGGGKSRDGEDCWDFNGCLIEWNRDTVRSRIGSKCVHRLVRDEQEFNSNPSQGIIQALNGWHLCHAGTTPCRPKIQENHLPFEIRKHNLPIGQSLEIPVMRLFVDGETSGWWNSLKI